METTKILVLECTVKSIMRKGNCPDEQHYVSIFIPHAMEETLDTEVLQTVEAYRNRGYAVNLVYSGCQKLRESLYSFLQGGKHLDNEGRAAK